MAVTVYRFATGRELWKLGLPGGNMTPADRRFVPGQVGAVTRSPNTAGKGQLKVAGLPTDSFSVRIEIMAEGNLGVATFRDSLDGGTTWELTKQVPADGVYVLPETGLTLNFTPGLSPSFQVGDVFTFATVESTQAAIMARAVSGRMARKLRVRGTMPVNQWGDDVKLICAQLWAYEMLCASGFDATSKYDAEVLARKKAAEEDLHQLAEEQQQSDLDGQPDVAGIALFSEPAQAKELW